MSGLTKITSLSRETIHYQAYFLGLCLLAMAMPTSRYMISVAQLLLGVNWIAEGNLKEKFRIYLNHKPALWFSLIFFIHLIGLLWTQDLIDGITGEIKTILPVFGLTLIIATSRSLPLHKIRVVLLLFSLSVFVTTLIGLYIYITDSYTDPRKIAPFVSHLYLSMMVLMAMLLLPWLSFQMTKKRLWRILSFMVVAWLLVFLFILSALTGIICLAGLIVYFLIKIILSGYPKIYRVLSGLFLFGSIMAGAGMLLYLTHHVTLEKPIPYDELSATTAAGNTYTHHLDSDLRENGHLVYIFLAEEELKEAWNQRSNLDFDGQDHQGNQLRGTLYRYMTSKGLRKDREGLMELCRKDIAAIEAGTPNYQYTQWPVFIVRTHQTIWELHQYRQTGNPTGHTFTQRLELWHASLIAFQEHPMFGWGTGDIYIAIHYGLEQIDSPMDNYHMKPHNQYLLFLLTFGILGSLATYASYILFVKSSGVVRLLPFKGFLIILLLAMVGNNPIEAQVGQTFFTFFSLVFALMYINQSEKASGA